MWMTDYIREIKRQFVEVYGLARRMDQPDNPEIVPIHVPDGDYPMTIEGKLDRVKIVNGFISCCNFDPTPKTARRRKGVRPAARRRLTPCSR
jgi:hypothetical protein